MPVIAALILTAIFAVYLAFSHPGGWALGLHAFAAVLFTFLAGGAQRSNSTEGMQFCGGWAIFNLICAAIWTWVIYG